MSAGMRGRLKLSVVVVILLAFVGTAAARQTGTGPWIPGSPMEQDFWRWATIQSGLLVALLIVLWSYRKDLVGTLASERERANVLIELIKSSTSANEKSAAASEATEKALHRLARALEALEQRIEG